MVGLKTVFYGSTAAFIGGSYYLHHNLSKRYPDIPTYELPSHSRIASAFKQSPKGTSIKYCDTFKISLDSSKFKDLQELRMALLGHPLISSLIETKSQPSSSKLLKIELQSIQSDSSRDSTLLKWGWKSPKYVQWFEWLASYGYPWRLMNGGLHEVYVERIGTDQVDVYFSSAHEYNDLRDGKLIPKLIQCAHRDYARILLELTFGDLRLKHSM